MEIMPVLSKKGVIKSLWVDLLCLAFLGQKGQKPLSKSTKQSTSQQPIYQATRKQQANLQPSSNQIANQSSNQPKPSDNLSINK